MSKTRKENIDSDATLPDDDFEEAEEVNIEDLESEVDKTKTAHKQAYDTRRRLEDLLDERRRKKKYDYPIEGDD